MKILIVEDDIEIQGLIKYYFEKEGYDVQTADDGEEGLKKLEKTRFDLIILDLMLSKLDGMSFTKIIKSKKEIFGDINIIMLTAKTEIEDVLAGLEIGADDYLKKPFDPRELILRSKKILKKKEKSVENIINYGNLFLNIDKRAVLDGQKEIELSKKEYKLLLLLMKKIGVVITRDEILEKVWNSNYYSGDRTVDVYISKLREKMPILNNGIKTIKGVGYRLEELK